MYQQGMPQGQGSPGMPQSQGSPGMPQGQGPYGMPQGQGPYGMPQGQGPYGMPQGQGSQGMQQGQGPSSHSHGMMQGAQVAPAYSQPQMMMMVAGGQSYGSSPQTMTCPYCQVTMTTRVQYECGGMTHVFALLLCFVGCCCLPYCGNCAKDAKHECANCRRYLGSGKPC